MACRPSPGHPQAHRRSSTSSSPAWPAATPRPWTSTKASWSSRPRAQKRATARSSTVGPLTRGRSP
eukprot:4156450-Alexandrium_andersonii.AAC.1